MKLFKDFTNDIEGIQNFKKKQFNDDDKLLRYLEKSNHKDFNFALMHLGVLLDTIATYSSFMEDQLREGIRKTNVTSRNRKLNKYLNDLNKRINSEYGFDEDTFIIEEGVLYDGEIYLFINKCNFVKIMQLNKA